MDLGRGKMLWVLGKTVIRLCDLHAGVSVQPGLFQMDAPDVAETGAIAAAQAGAVDGPQSRQTGKAGRLVEGSKVAG